MGQGQLGGTINRAGVSPASLAVQRYRVLAAFVLTTLFVAVKTVGHDLWSVGFGLAVLGMILLTPQSPEHAEPWRQHALRVVSACFVVVTLASIWTTLTGG